MSDIKRYTLDELAHRSMSLLADLENRLAKLEKIQPNKDREICPICNGVGKNQYSFSPGQHFHCEKCNGIGSLPK